MAVEAEDVAVGRRAEHHGVAVPTTRPSLRTVMRARPAWLSENVPCDPHRVPGGLQSGARETRREPDATIPVDRTRRDVERRHHGAVGSNVSAHGPVGVSTIATTGAVMRTSIDGPRADGVSRTRSTGSAASVPSSGDAYA